MAATKMCLVPPATALKQDKESLVKVSMVVTPEEEAIQQKPFEVTWTDEESGVAKKAKKVNFLKLTPVSSTRASRNYV